MNRFVQNFLAPVFTQGLFSLSQTTVTLVGTVSLPGESWGRLAVLLTLFFVANGIVRGFGAQPLVTFLSTADVRAARRAATGLGLIAATPFVVSFPLLGAAWGLPGAGLGLAIAFITYTAYDVARTVELATGTHARLAIADALLLLIVGGGSAVALVTPAPATLTVPVAMAARYCAALFVLPVGGAEGQWTLHRFATTFRHDVLSLAFDGLMLGASMSSVVLALAWLATPAAAGEYRTAFSLVAGPLQMVFVAISPRIIRGVREHSLGETARSWRFTAGVVTGGLVTAVLWGAAASLVALQIDEVSRSAATLVFATPVLMGALWACSMLTVHQRFRRRPFEMSAVRALSTLSTALVVPAALAAPTPPVFAVLLGAAGALVLPSAHFALARRVVREGPPTTSCR